jgi:hypothetical protein
MGNVLDAENMSLKTVKETGSKMYKKMVIGLCALFVVLIIACTWCYNRAKVQMVQIPSTQQINMKKYRIVHTDTVSMEPVKKRYRVYADSSGIIHTDTITTDPFFILRIYYVER